MAIRIMIKRLLFGAGVAKKIFESYLTNSMLFTAF